MGVATRQTRPDTRSGRAALTDAGVDGGARADRNHQAWGKAPVVRSHLQLVRKFVSR